MSHDKMNPSEPLDLIALAAKRLKPWQTVLGVLAVFIALLGTFSWIERTYGIIGGQMGWIRQSDMTAHRKEHAEDLKKAFEPVGVQLSNLSKQIDTLNANKYYSDYKQTLWQVQALQDKRNKEGHLSWQDTNRLIDLQSENDRLKREYMRLREQQARP